MQKLQSIFEKSLFWVLLLLLVFIPLYPKFPLVNVKGTFVAIRLEDFLIALVLSVWGIFMILTGKYKDLIKDKLNQTILVFFFVGFVSTFSASFLTHTVSPHLAL